MKGSTLFQTQRMFPRWCQLLVILGILLLICGTGLGNHHFLTAGERAWLNAHDGAIRIAYTPDWPPMDFLDANGRPQGMAADYMRLIQKKLGIRFKMVRVKSWDEMLAFARTGHIDVISAGQATEERRTFMNWSTPFLNLKTTIIVRKGRRGELTLDRMQGMSIGVVRNYAVGDFIRDLYPDLTLVDVASSSDGIRKVSFGELDAMITEVPNALYIIEQEKITNLRLAGETGFELNHGMGIRKDWPEFHRIIENVLAGITVQEHRAIYSRWVRLETPRFYQTRAFWYSVLGTTAAVMIVIGSILLWNRELKKQVTQRTRELRFNEIGLEALLALNERHHRSIRDVIEFAFRQMLEITRSSFGYLALEAADGLTYVVDSGHDSDATVEFRVHNGCSGFDCDTKGFWGEAVRKARPVISNDYRQSNPLMKGVPAAHQTIVRYMNVPIFSEGKIVVVAGMGNKATDYTNSDLRQLNSLTHGMWRLIQRKTAEQAIQQSEKRFQDLVENSPNGIAIIQGGTVVYENPGQKELLGGMDFFSASEAPRFHQEDADKARVFFDQIARGDLKRTETAFRFYPPDAGNREEAMKWVDCIAAPIDYHDGKAVLLTTIDMTEAKKLEHLLTVQDKMASLGHVSAGIAHEIRNPLSGINIYLRAIEKHFRNPDREDKIASSITAIRTASQKIESVIKRVMNFAKPSEPKFALIHINEPVKEAVNLTGFTLRKKGIELVLDLDEHLPACYAEPYLIEEVVLNLINNAADAFPDDQADKCIRITSGRRGDTIRVGVADNGPGIPRDLRDKIFDPFFTTKEYSTGIGLSLCHRIITDHRGRLNVATAENGGAVFVIELPVSANADSNADNTPTAASA